jgi:large subunit ribosomal protein L21
MADAATTAKTPAFSVIQTGGKQYVVREGDTITIEKLPGEHKVGDKVTFDEVLMTDTGAASKIGTPFVSGAKVQAELVELGRTPKTLVVRFKSKSNYRKVKGHRQPFAKVKITKIA